jgi:hypothetical protein
MNGLSASSAPYEKHTSSVCDGESSEMTSRRAVNGSAMTSPSLTDVSVGGRGVAARAAVRAALEYLHWASDA